MTTVRLTTSRASAAMIVGVTRVTVRTASGDLTLIAAAALHPAARVVHPPTAAIVVGGISSARIDAVTAKAAAWRVGVPDATTAIGVMRAAQTAQASRVATTVAVAMAGHVGPAVMAQRASKLVPDRDRRTVVGRPGLWAGGAPRRVPGTTPRSGAHRATLRTTCVRFGRGTMTLMCPKRSHRATFTRAPATN